MVQNEGICIKNPGMMTLLMDEGRIASMHSGLTESGPMDETAAEWANWLCANTRGPFLEVVGKITLEFTCKTSFAVTGPVWTITVNGNEYAPWCAINVLPGDIVEATPSWPTARMYIAAAGKWQVPRLAGSCATVCREQLGGLNNAGTPLKENDTITIGDTRHTDEREVPVALQPEYGPGQIDFICGYQCGLFTDTLRQQFFNQTFSLTPASDRMGFRLKGHPLPHSITSLMSEGITLGALQIPQDGQPIVMMRDRQTLGGYPKLGCIARYDLSRFAQCQPGDDITFREVDIENARGEWLLRYHYRERYKQSFS